MRGAALRHGGASVHASRVFASSEQAEDGSRGRSPHHDKPKTARVDACPTVLSLFIPRNAQQVFVEEVEGQARDAVAAVAVVPGAVIVSLGPIEHVGDTE